MCSMDVPIGKLEALLTVSLFGECVSSLMGEFKAENIKEQYYNLGVLPFQSLSLFCCSNPRS